MVQKFVAWTIAPNRAPMSNPPSVSQKPLLATNASRKLSICAVSSEPALDFRWAAFRRFPLSPAVTPASARSASGLRSEGCKDHAGSPGGAQGA